MQAGKNNARVGHPSAWLRWDADILKVKCQHIYKTFLPKGFTSFCLPPEGLLPGRPRVGIRAADSEHKKERKGFVTPCAPLLMRYFVFSLPATHLLPLTSHFC